MPKTIGGICPIVATPFDAAGRVDLDSLAHLVRHLCRTGVQGLTLFGLSSAADRTPGSGNGGSRMKREGRADLPRFPGLTVA